MGMAVHGVARPSFFWYDNDKDLKVCFPVTHLMCELTNIYKEVLELL